jgi:hypothetical protein
MPVSRCAGVLTRSASKDVQEVDEAPFVALGRKGHGRLAGAQGVVEATQLILVGAITDDGGDELLHRPYEPSDFVAEPRAASRRKEFDRIKEAFCVELADRSGTVAGNEGGEASRHEYRMACLAALMMNRRESLADVRSSLGKWDLLGPGWSSKRRNDPGFQRQNAYDRADFTLEFTTGLSRLPGLIPPSVADAPEFYSAWPLGFSNSRKAATTAG